MLSLRPVAPQKMLWYLRGNIQLRQGAGSKWRGSCLGLQKLLERIQEIQLSTVEGGKKGRKTGNRCQHQLGQNRESVGESGND